MGFEGRLIGLAQLEARVRGARVQILGSKPKPGSAQEQMLIRQMTGWQAVLMQSRQAVRNDSHLNNMLLEKSRFTQHAYSAGQRHNSKTANNSKMSSALDGLWDAIKEFREALLEPDPIEKVAMEALSKVLKNMQKSGDDGGLGTVPREDVMPMFQQMQPSSGFGGDGLNPPGPMASLTLIAMLIAMMVSALNKKK